MDPLAGELEHRKQNIPSRMKGQTRTRERGPSWEADDALRFYLLPGASGPAARIEAEARCTHWAVRILSIRRPAPPAPCPLIPSPCAVTRPRNVHTDPGPPFPRLAQRLDPSVRTCTHVRVIMIREYALIDRSLKHAVCFSRLVHFPFPLPGPLGALSFRGALFAPTSETTCLDTGENQAFSWLAPTSKAHVLRVAFTRGAARRQANGC